MNLSRASFASLSLLAVSAGCMAPVDSGAGPDAAGDQRAAPGTDRIKGGASSTAYPEAALIDMYDNNGQIFAACSGSVIAPRVVLTAGHCVLNVGSWQVTTPHAGGQSVSGSQGALYDWSATSGNVDPNQHDIGLVVLDSPITLKTYPTLSKTPVKDGTKVVNIGRINNGTLSDTDLFVSPAVTVQGAASQGFPFDYVAVDKIESGDSGGPDMLVGTHTIVAVNSGAGGNTEVLARVDLVYAWIQQIITQSNGGAGGSGGQGAGGAGGAAGSGSAGSSGKGSGGSGTAGSSGSIGCAHNLCQTGKALSAACDPCVANLCSQDSFCCNNSWDATCVQEAQWVCGTTCP